MSTQSNENGAVGEGGEDWRKSVSQSSRNLEVREIAQVLASLEPGATSSSKLGLAVTFEGAVFKQAKSFADYKKKLVKRLSKLKKNYVPATAAEGVTSSYKNKKDLVMDLRLKYGETLRFIAKNADAAINELKLKKAPDKATQLELHTNLAIKWAKDLGLVGSQQQQQQHNPAAVLSDAYLKKMQENLEHRLENVRCHVVKLTSPDQFLLENLEKTEASLAGRSTAKTTPVVPTEAGKILAENTKSRLSGSDGTSTATTFPALGGISAAFDPYVLLKDSLEKAQTTVPPPTRAQRNESKGALIHLEKMRAASTAIVAYLSIPDKTTVAPQTLAKTYRVATQGIEFVGNVMKQQRKETKEPEVTLEDAWNKVNRLSLPPEPAQQLNNIPVIQASGSFEAATPTGTGGLSGPGITTSPIGTSADSTTRMNKRAKLSSLLCPPILRCRVLFTTGRKTPMNLIPEFKRKRVTLVRPAPKGQGSHLILEFGDAFVMTVLFAPLLVTLRACAETTTTTNLNANGVTDKNNDGASHKPSQPTSSSTNNTVATSQAPNTSNPSAPAKTNSNSQSVISSSPWMPIHQGLSSREELQVWGVKGTYETIGHVVEERLRDASAHATQVLRRSFANEFIGKEYKNPIEIEILEASALLKFLENVRKTYIPNWQDEEVQ